MGKHWKEKNHALLQSYSVAVDCMVSKESSVTATEASTSIKCVLKPAR